MTDFPEPAAHSIADYERAAIERMSDDARSYIGGGAGNEITLRDNEAAWRRLALRPRALGAPDGADTGVELLGIRRPHPILVAPTAFARLTHPDGELGIARAAAATSTIMCLATLASVSPAAVATDVPAATRWFQLYVFSDRGASHELVAAAAAHGYEAVVVTVDRPVLGVRERELRAAVRESEALGNERPTDTSAVIDPRLRWSDIEQLAAASPLPVLVKGLLTAEDARRAAAHGAAGVIVSNHGGRQLDTVLAAADALPEVVDAVGGQLDVLVDGGIRRGTDVVKALALGACAVLIGRPALWGLAVGGAAGVQRVLEILLAELENALTLLGAPSIGDLNRSFLTPGALVCSDAMNILVTGISGYIGSVLAPALQRHGHTVRGFARRPERVTLDVPLVTGDILTGEGLQRALEGIETAYFLIHSMERAGAKSESFSARERAGAQRFAQAARDAGVKRIVYLGGPAPVDGPRSAHLTSRLAVEEILLGAVPGSVALRASIVIGARSRSFAFLVRLVERLPVLALPGWGENRTQPIDERDVIAFLVSAATSEAVSGMALDIAGPDVVSYGELIARIADLMLVGRPAVRFKRLTVTPIASRVAAAIAGEAPEFIEPLMESLNTDLLPRDDRATELLMVRLHSLNSAIEHSLAEWEKSEPLAAR